MNKLNSYKRDKKLIDDITKGLEFDAVETAGFIREKHSGVLSTILEIGAHLLNAKGELPHGEYEIWVKDHCGLSLSTARFYASCARRGYHKRDEIANMRASAFASLMKLPDDIFSLALEEGELEGRSLDELSKRDIENYYEKLKADRDIERRKRMECEDRIEKGGVQLFNARKDVERLEKEIVRLEDPSYLSRINLERASSLIGEVVVVLIKLSNMKVPSGEAGKILSPLLIATQGLQDKWGPKWES